MYQIEQIETRAQRAQCLSHPHAPETDKAIARRLWASKNGEPLVASVDERVVSDDIVAACIDIAVPTIPSSDLELIAEPVKSVVPLVAERCLPVRCRKNKKTAARKRTRKSRTKSVTAKTKKTAARKR